MLTLKLKITNINQEDKEFIISLQKQYSIAFRKMYRNIELIEDKNFIDEIISKHIHSNKAYSYLIKEVIAFKEREKSNKERINKNIIKLHEKLKNETKPNLKKKLQRKISSLNKSLNLNVVFGGRKLLQVITKQKISNPELYLKNKQKFKENRLLPITFYGDSASKGNRFFNLKELGNGNVIFKYENSKRKVNISFYATQKQKGILKIIALLCQQKEIPVTIKLTSTYICITYEESRISGKWFNEKQLYKDIKHVTDKTERKQLISQAHRDHEQRMFGIKMQNRYCGIDLNPKGIGYSICDKNELSSSLEGDFKIIKKGFIDFVKLSEKEVSSDKRKHELSIAIKNLFSELEHYHTCNFVIEELTNISGKDNGNKNSNRQINNIWCRNLIAQLSDKWCSFYGIKKIEINPCYSSFIGNINYNTFDPIAASIEICRRGMIKYIKGGKFMPSFHEGVITNVSNITQMDYNELQNISSWKEMCKRLQLTKKSVRRANKNNYLFQQNAQNKTEKSKVKTMLFL